MDVIAGTAYGMDTDALADPNDSLLYNANKLMRSNQNITFFSRAKLILTLILLCMYVWDPGEKNECNLVKYYGFNGGRIKTIGSNGPYQSKIHQCGLLVEAKS